MGGYRKRRLSDTQERADIAPLQGSDGARQHAEIRLEEEETQNKARRKAERKAQKKLKKEQAQGLNGATISPGAEPDPQTNDAFDYANAESVLHAKRDINDRGAPKKKAFDPYTKSMDAPKGMRKTKREIAGKSFTFPR